MSASFTSLIAATLAFVLGHFVLSATPVRTALAGALGRTGFLVAYSLYAIATFVWMNVAFAHAPFEDLWGDPGWARWLAVAVMPLPSVLLAAGILTANPSAVGFEKLMAANRPPMGIQKVTRHPIQWAIALWAALHVAANGDLASVIFFGGILILSLAGMVHMEARKRAEPGEAWSSFAERSSFIPFAAILKGHVRLSPGEIGWSRIAAGIILYLVFLFGHRIAIDVPLLPQLAG
jgi:uncharacterized membrane protein